MGRLANAWHALTRKSLALDEMRNLVEATYYSAASESSSMDFSHATDIGLNRALFNDLNKLRTRCRYELRQNGLAKGMARVYANSVVGPGPLMAMHSDMDPEWAQNAENEFAAWARTVDSNRARGGSLGMQLHLGIRQLFTAGEYFLVPRSFGDGPVRLRYLMIRPDRVKTPASMPVGYGNAEIDQGVEVDGDGRPIAYWVTKTDPDNTPSGVILFDDFMRVDADKMIHVFWAEDPIQHRGEPWLAQSLPVFHKLRRYDEATIAAAIVAAKFAAVLVNTNPDVVEDVRKILPSTVMEIQDGMMLVPPPGYEPKQITPQHPATNAEEFRRDQIATAGAANAMPANIAKQDSKDNSFAAMRFDGVSFQQEGAVCRRLAEDLHLSAVEKTWRDEAISAGVIDTAPADATAAWLWPREDRHTDPLKQANADKTRVATGLYSIGDIQMQQGIDRDKARETLLREVQWYRNNQLKHPLDAEGDSGQADVENTTDNDEEAHGEDDGRVPDNRS